MELLLGFNAEVLHNSCNPCTCVLPDMYTFIPQACGPREYKSGRTLVSMLQLLNVCLKLKGRTTRSFSHILSVSALGTDLKEVNINEIALKDEPA